MKKMSLAHTGFDLVNKLTRMREFLIEMDVVISWFELMTLIAPLASVGKTGRPRFPSEVMPRIHLLQQVFAHLSAMEKALHDIPLYRQFAYFDAGIMRLPDESTILRFRRLREERELGQQILATVNGQLVERGLLLKTGTVVDSTLIVAPSSTRKAHMGADADSGPVHSVTTTGANVHDITRAHPLLHGEGEQVFAYSGQRGAQKREEIPGQHSDVDWHVALMPGQRKAMVKSKPVDALREQLEKLKVRMRANGRALVSDDQVRVRSPQCSLLGTGREHQPSAGDVRTVESVDREQSDFAQSACMSAPAAGAKAQKRKPCSLKKREIGSQFSTGFAM